MEIYFGKGKKPKKGSSGHACMIFIQERIYNKRSDLLRAKSQIDRLFRDAIAFPHYEVDGKPKLYYSRLWTENEILRAGYSPEDFEYFRRR